MARVRKKNKLSKTSIVVAGLVVLLGLPLLVFSLQQRTETQQHASEFKDFNTSYDITATNNADGTMGPVDYLGNISKTFPEVYLGSLNLLVTDPPQPQQNKGFDNRGNGNPHILPTQAQGYQNQNNTTASNPATYGNNPSVTRTQTNTAGGPQTVTSLKITVKKAEVHLAHIGLPGSRNQDVTPTPRSKPTGPHIKTNAETDKWETLSMTTPQTLDLVELYKSHSLAPLCLTKLVNGRYTQIRLYISSATATLQNGTTVNLVIPGRNNIVKIVRPFVINSSKTTTLTIDFDAQNSVIKAGDQYILKPVVAKIIDQTP